MFLSKDFSIRSYSVKDTQTDRQWKSIVQLLLYTEVQDGLDINTYVVGDSPINKSTFS